MRLQSVLASVLIVLGFGLVNAQAAQPNGIELNNSGISYVYPPFCSESWSLTRWSGIGAHNGDDYFAQDWARGCGQTRGQVVYASISGDVAIAGWQNGYGNTVVIFDSESRFALRYAHLDSIAVSQGQAVVAGETIIGKVGNTGNTASSSCQIDPGSHLHLVLYKNVTDSSSRPITSVRARGQATAYAADLRYVSHLTLAKANSDPTVYAIDNGTRRPVSWFVFNNQGWNFDQNHSLFNPVQVWPEGQLQQYPIRHFYTPRDGTLVKGDRATTVSLILRDQRRAISYAEFTCRGFSFAEVITVSQGEHDSYPLGSDLLGCSAPAGDTNDDQARNDMEAFLRRDFRFVSLDWQSFGRDLNLDPSWEFRWIEVVWSGNRRTSCYHITFKYNRAIRYAGFVDPDTGQWTGWTQVQ